MNVHARLVTGAGADLAQLSQRNRNVAGASVFLVLEDGTWQPGLACELTITAQPYAQEGPELRAVWQLTLR